MTQLERLFTLADKELMKRFKGKEGLLEFVSQLRPGKCIVIGYSTTRPPKKKKGGAEC